MYHHKRYSGISHQEKSMNQMLVSLMVMVLPEVQWQLNEQFQDFTCFKLSVQFTV